MSTRLNQLFEGRRRVEAGWCQFTEAIDATGMPVEADDKAAVAFCAFGALLNTLHPDQRTSEATRVLDTLAEFLPSPNGVKYAMGLGCDVVAYNDLPTTTQQDILTLFDKAIAHQLAVEEA